MYKTVGALQAYHKALGLEVGLYHLDPFWHSHHPDGHCDGVTASNWSHSAFHWSATKSIYCCFSSFPHRE